MASEITPAVRKAAGPAPKMGSMGKQSSGSSGKPCFDVGAVKRASGQKRS